MHKHIRIFKMLSTTDIGNKYIYEISRKAAGDVKAAGDIKADHKVEGDTIVENKETSVNDINITQIDKFQGELSDIIQDPDKSPRYIFTNVSITANCDNYHTQLHSVPASMVENIQLLN